MYACYVLEIQEEQKERGRLNRKVSKYKDKDGEIAKEVIQCMGWINELSKNREHTQRICIKKLKLANLYTNSKKLKHQNIDIENGRYAKSLLQKAFKENKFYIPKKRKENDICIYDNIGMYKFILALLEAIKRGETRQFIDIPDVFYIIRQVRKVGIEYYVS